MSVLSIDFETRATVNLKATGVYPYAAHKDTDIWCMAWAFDDDEPEIWTPVLAAETSFGKHFLHIGRILNHIRDGGEIRAWNAQFERIVWREIMVKRYGAPPVRDEQWVCSAAEAAAMALPRGLDQAARVLGAKQTKDSEGYNLMMRMTRPRKIEADGTIVWWDVEERKQRLYEYCKQDVRVERAIVKSLRRLTPRERDIYLLDQRTNDAGAQIDLELVHAASIISTEAVTRANATIRRLTDGTVPKVTNHKQLRQWLNEQGIGTESTDKAAVRELLDADLEPTVRAVLETRADAGLTSVAKLQDFVDVAGTDGRARGLLLYHGASTGRWTGKLVQPQNFPRGSVDEVESLIPLVLSGDYDALECFAPPLQIISSMLRSMIIAAPGHDLLAADYSAIEARVLNWLAGQDDIVKLFRDGVDVYKHNATRLYNISYADVQKFPHRQTGKFQELGCGYGMGAAKAVSAAKDTYGLILTEVQAKSIVDNYRDTHQQVVEFWYATEGACKKAIRTPGVVQRFGVNDCLGAVVSNNYLYIMLPSKRPLCYAAPHLAERVMPWSTPENPAVKESIFFYGVDPKSKQWGKLTTYGGMLVENIVQAVSRDLMAEGMLRIEAAGYTPVLSVHDEIVAEAPHGFGSVAEFERLMAELPAWGKGCPVAAEGWRGARYRK